MISKEEEKNYKKPKISKIWNFLIYGSSIAIGVFLIWLYSAYIFINKWKKVKKGINVKKECSAWKGGKCICHNWIGWQLI